MNNGWIKLYRTLMNDCLWLQGTPIQKNLMIVLLLSSNALPFDGIFEGEKIIINRGQFLTSLESLKQKIGKGVTIQKIRTALKNLEKYDFITNKSTKVGRLITVVNYSKYQDGNIEGNKHIDNKVAESKQIYNKAVTPNNKDNKENKEINKAQVRFQKSKRKEVGSKNAKSSNFTERKYTPESMQDQIRSFYSE